MFEKIKLTYEAHKDKHAKVNAERAAAIAEHEEKTALIEEQERQSRERRYQKAWKELPAMQRMLTNFDEWRAKQEFERLELEANPDASGSESDTDSNPHNTRPRRKRGSKHGRAK